jgi:predicted AlkP superfamily phosphohydrolase/phosphomutase
MNGARGGHHRVLVVGLDGATFDLIGPWIEAGHLPTLAAIMANGVHGPLQSTYPPLTGPAWASFMTGKAPANHGVLEFFHRAPDSYERVLNSRLDIDGHSIWRVLSDSGSKVGVIGVPLTYPPEQVKGSLVTGLLTPREAEVGYTWPPELGDEIEKAVGPYRLQRTQTYSGDPAKTIAEERAILENLVDTALYMMRAQSWDFFMLHVLGTDVIQHGFWHLGDPTHPKHDVALRAVLGNPVLDFWRLVDDRLAEVLAAVPNDAYVIIMSDHGFGPIERFVNFNVWLLDRGFLKLKQGLCSTLRQVGFRLGYNYATVARLGAKLGVNQEAHRLGRARREVLQRRFFLSFDDVDWRRTQVYSSGNFGQMFVNLAGREPLGCVSPGHEYERLLDRLEEELGAMVDPVTGEHVVESVWRGSDLFDGAYARHAPDLFFLTKEMKYKAMGLSDFGSNQVFDDLYSTYAHHRMAGVFMMRGPGVRRGAEVPGARLIDLAPTIYALMHTPVPPGVDGHVLNTCFMPGWRPDAARARMPARSDDAGVRETAYSAEEEAALAEQLRRLGYVS